MQTVRSLVLVTLLSSVGLSSVVVAQTYPVRGAGTTGCGTYLEWRGSNDQPSLAQATQWAWGYLHGYNVTAGDPIVEAPDKDTVLAYLEKFCRENPLKPLAWGLPSLVEDLGGARNKLRLKK